MIPLNVYPYNRPAGKNRHSLPLVEQYLSDFWRRPALILDSARVGLYEIARFFNLTRRDHILVPDFMCQAVLNIFNRVGFPVKIPDERTRAVLVFHQWGYPQKMNEIGAEAKKRNLIVIEDCAHSLDSQYQGKTIGSFGEAAVFSFSKLLPVYLGGAVVTNNQQLLKHLKQVRQEKQNWKNNLFNFIAFSIARKSFEKKKWQSWLDLVYLASINYPNIKKGALRLLPADLNALAEIQSQRRENYKYLRDHINSQFLIPDHDQDIKPNPMYLPVFLESEKLLRAKKNLLNQKIETEILHFDVNRNLFQPHYQKCLAVPTHQNLPLEIIKIIPEIINQT